jgi:hypothetical protein
VTRKLSVSLCVFVSPLHPCAQSVSKGHIVEQNIRENQDHILYGGCTGIRRVADSCGILRPSIESIFCGFVQSRDVDIRGSELSWHRHGNPGNIETRNILVGGVDCLHVHSHGSEGHVVERNIGESGILCTVVALASAEFALIPAGFSPSQRSICCSFIVP